MVMFFTTLKHKYLTNCTGNQVRNCCKSVFSFHSYQQGPAMLLGPHSPLNTKYLHVILSRGLTCCGPSTGRLMVTSFTTAPVSSHTFRSIFFTDPETPFNQPSENAPSAHIKLDGESHTAFLRSTTGVKCSVRSCETNGKSYTQLFYVNVNNR